MSITYVYRGCIICCTTQGPLNNTSSLSNGSHAVGKIRWNKLMIIPQRQEARTPLVAAHCPQMRFPIASEPVDTKVMKYVEGEKFRFRGNIPVIKRWEVPNLRPFKQRGRQTSDSVPLCSPGICHSGKTCRKQWWRVFNNCYPMIYSVHFGPVMWRAFLISGNKS